MWVITGPWRVPGVDKESEEWSRVLLPDHTYKIGRSDKLLLGVKQSSVSKIHATVVVGPHSELDAADLDARPNLTVQPLPSVERPKEHVEGQPPTSSWKDFVVHIDSGTDKVRLPTAGENEAPAARALKDGDIISFSMDGPRFRVAWRPVIFKLDVVTKAQPDLVKKIAPLGLKMTKKDYEGLVTHIVHEAIKNIAKPSLLAALAGETRIVSPAFLAALTHAAAPLPPCVNDSSSKEQWSALELDVVSNWPSEDEYAPKFEVAGEDAARGSVLWDDARQTLLGGLTVVGLGNDTDLATRTAKSVVERCGGSFIIVNPAKLVPPVRASLQATLQEHKKAADKAYPAYLRQAGRRIPAAARNSGLVYLLAGHSFASDLAERDLTMDDVSLPGESLGLALASLKALGLSLFQSDVTPLLTASRRSGAVGEGSQSLPSQISASLTSSRGQPDPSLSPNAASVAAAGSTGKSSIDAADDTSFDVGDDDHDIGDLSLDILAAPASPPVRPVSQIPATAPPTRASTSTNPLDNWGSAIPPPAARNRRKATSAAGTQAQASLTSLPQSGQSSLSASSQPQVDDSFEEPAPQSERAKSLYHTIRAKSRGDLASQPSIATRGQSLASGQVDEKDDDDGEAFVEGQRKRRRAEHAVEEEKRKRARLEDSGMDDVQEDSPGGISGGQSSREASAMVDSAPGPRAPGSMPPPPVPSRAKRKADDIGAPDTDFLRAPVKRKRKGQAEDALDVDFNNLKIAKLPARSAGADDTAAVENGNAQPRLVEVLVPLFQRTKHARQAPTTTAMSDIRGFGKFRSNKDPNAPRGTRRHGPSIPTVDSGNASRARDKRDTKSQAAVDEDEKPMAVDSQSAASNSGSAAFERATQAGSAGTSGPSVGRRKKLIAAGDSDDDVPVRATARGRKKAVTAGPVSDDDGAVAGSRPTPRTTATLDDSDEDGASVARPKARAGRKKLIQADDSDEESFKGWGGTSRSKRR